MNTQIKVGDTIQFPGIFVQDGGFAGSELKIIKIEGDIITGFRQADNTNIQFDINQYLFTKI